MTGIHCQQEDEEASVVHSAKSSAPSRRIGRERPASAVSLNGSTKGGGAGRASARLLRRPAPAQLSQAGEESPKSPAAPGAARATQLTIASTVPSEVCSPTKRPGSSPAAGRGTGTQLSVSRIGSRPGTPGASPTWGSSRNSRFSTEEKNCFKRILTPSASCDGKLDVYFRGPGTFRNIFTQEGLNQIPVLKGKFYHHPAFQTAASPTSRAVEKAKARRRQKDAGEQKVDPLPQEGVTSMVLDEIYPKSPAGGTLKSPARSEGRQSKVSKLRAHTWMESSGHWASEPFGTPDKPALGSAGGVVTATSSLPQPSLVRSRTPGTGRTLTGDIQNAGAGLGWTTSDDTQRAGGVHPEMQNFRRQVLSKFPSVKVAFECLAAEFPIDHSLTKKEWRRVLGKYGFTWSSVKERDSLFDQLDISGDGAVSPTEFQIAVEAAAPVRTLEDLRRRWLASGYGSMMQPINMLDNNGHTTHRRLTLREFGEAMAEVKVGEPSEFTAIFNLVSSDGHRVSIAELASAIATVSPCLILEDLRERLVKKYGSLEKAFWDIDHDHSSFVSKQEWGERCIRRIGLSEAEAKIAFRLIDIDESGEVSKYEFLCALGLSEPYLFFEDLRRKVRQRFRSIKQAIVSSFGMTRPDEDPLTRRPLPLQKYQEILDKLFIDDVVACNEPILNEEETKLIFDAADVNGEGTLTAATFLKSIHHFAPSTVLEDLRLVCLQRSSNIAEVFDGVNVDRSEKLDYQKFKNVLNDLGFVHTVNIQAIIDLLDLRLDGSVSCGRLIAALRSGSPGSAPRLPPEERDLRARQDVRLMMSDMQKQVDELRSQVRAGLDWSDEATAASVADAETEEPASPESPTAGEDEQTRTQKPGTPVAAGGSSPQPTTRAARSQSPNRRSSSVRSSVVSSKDLALAFGASRKHSEEEAPPLTPSVSAPRLRLTPHEVLAPYVENIAFRTYDPKKTSQHSFTGAQISWNQVWNHIKTSPGGEGPERARLEKDLHGYFQLATYSLSHDVPLLQDMHRNSDVHVSKQRHLEALKSNKVKMMIAAHKEQATKDDESKK